MNNPPAFPEIKVVIPPTGQGYYNITDGMSLRDFFANSITPVLIQSFQYARYKAEMSAEITKKDKEDIAKSAYIMAEAMLKEREKYKEDK